MFHSLVTEGRIKVGTRVRGGRARFQDTAYRSTLLVVGPGNASLLHVAALVAAVKICMDDSMGFSVWFFWRRSGRAEPYNRITSCTDCTPCQYMSKDSRSPAWPNVPVSKCECVPAPLILILRALPTFPGGECFNLHTPLKPKP